MPPKRNKKSSPSAKKDTACNSPKLPEKPTSTEAVALTVPSAKVCAPPIPPSTKTESIPAPEVCSESKPESDIDSSSKKTYSKRKVFSNWERYSEPIVEREEENVNNFGDDFQKLLDAPLSADGHFRFKSEKFEPPPSVNLFTLDVKTLSTSLASIPFHKLLDLPEEYFDPEEIISMDKQAARNFKCLKNTSNVDTSRIISILSEKAPSILKPKVDVLVVQACVPANKAQPLSIATDTSSVQETTEVQSDDASCSPQVLVSPETLSSDLEKYTLDPLLTTPPKAQREKKVKGSINSNSKSNSFPEVKSTPQDINPPEGIFSEKIDPLPVASSTAISANINTTFDVNPINTEIPSDVPVAKPNEDLDKWLDAFLEG